MTLTQFVAKNAFRNRRRSVLTIVSISFSLLLLTLMMTVYRTFYIDEDSPDSALRLLARHRVSLTFFMPEAHREKIRTIPGVRQVAPMTWFGGKYKDDRPENFFAQFATDPQEIFSVYADWKVDPDQLKAWQRDRSGAAVSRTLAEKYGWKLGDRVHLSGTIFPVNPELTIRAIYDAPPSWNALLLDKEYIQESVSWFKGRAGIWAVLVDSPESVSRVAIAMDEQFRNSPYPTKTETEKAFQLNFVAMLGNVKAFILGISGAVVFAILLVSANTMAMTIRERIREVAVLKTLGFTRRAILGFFVGEAVAISLFGGLLGVMAAGGLVSVISNSPQGAMFGEMSVTTPTALFALLVAAIVGLVSSAMPAYRASQLDIAEGLRHLG